jgi:thioredoxin reductase (NADPH)
MLEKFDVLIIGAGPAGMSAALAAKQSGFHVALLEKSMPGGKLNTYQTLENFPGYEHLQAQAFGLSMYDALTKAGVTSTYGHVVDVVRKEDGFVVTTDAGEFLSKTIVIASGTKEKPLTIPGGERLFGQGISYCPACDGGFFKGKDVAVIGSDSHALQETIFLANICHHVDLLLPVNETIGSQNLMVKIHQLNNVRVITQVTPLEVLGDQVVKGLRYSTPSEKEQALMLDGVFAILGWVPNHEFLNGFPTLLNAQGFAIADEDGLTTVPGLFVIGDIKAKVTRQIKNVIAQGQRVIRPIRQYLNGSSTD